MYNDVSNTFYGIQAINSNNIGIKRHYILQIKAGTIPNEENKFSKCKINLHLISP